MPSCGQPPAAFRAQGQGKLRVIATPFRLGSAERRMQRSACAATAFQGMANDNGSELYRLATGAAVGRDMARFMSARPAAGESSGGVRDSALDHRDLRVPGKQATRY